MEDQGNLHMIGGEGDTSYALNSYIPTKALSIARPLLMKTVEDLLEELKHTECLKSFVMADLGCASGPNTMSVISTVLSILLKFHKESKSSMEVQVYLNDLPGNDFNSIFRSIPSYIQQLKASNDDDLSCYIAGVPGTFHGRLFPKRRLHLVHASYSVQWLSKLPSGICDQKMNKGRIYISKSSPLYIWKAYLEQFKEDFTCFLQHRSQEMVGNGRMLLILPCRGISDSTRKDMVPILTLLGDSLLAMVSEGLIQEEKLDAFHLPVYLSSAQEVEDIVSSEGSFIIEKMEGFVVNFVDVEVKDLGKGVEKIAKLVRSFTEPLISHHFGAEIIDLLYERFFTHALKEYLSKDILEMFNLIVVLKRKM